MGSRDGGKDMIHIEGSQEEAFALTPQQRAKRAYSNIGKQNRQPAFEQFYGFHKATNIGTWVGNVRKVLL